MQAYNVYRCWVSEYNALPELDADGNAVAIESIQLENRGVGTAIPLSKKWRSLCSLIRVSRARFANAILSAWEGGERRDPVDRALLLLQLAQPEQPLSDLAALSVGERNAHVLQLREQLLGDTLRCRVQCPECGVVLEFTLNTDDIRSRQAAAQLRCEILAHGVRLQLRPPNSLDLAAVAQSPDTETARHVVLRRCVARATRRGRALAVDALSAATVDAIAEALEELDPLAALPLRLASGTAGTTGPRISTSEHLCGRKPAPLPDACCARCINWRARMAGASRIFWL